MRSWEIRAWFLFLVFDVHLCTTILNIEPFWILATLAWLIAFLVAVYEATKDFLLKKASPNE